MCGGDSQTMQDFSMGATALGTYQQMQAAKQNAAYQANVANQNASIAQAQAISVGQQGAAEQAQIRQRARQVTGAQKASLSASGLDIGSGSPLSILADTAYQSEQDVQTSRYNTALQMWGLNNQAANYRSQASNAIAAGNNAATSTLLTGVTSLAKQYSSYNNQAANTKKQSPVNYGTALAPTDANGNYFIGNNNYTLTNPSTKKYKRYF
jgi:hypothetical protein